MKRLSSIKGEMSRNDFNILIEHINEILKETGIFMAVEEEILEQNFDYNEEGEPNCLAISFCTVSSMADLSNVLINTKNYPKIKRALNDLMHIYAKLKILGFSFAKDSNMADLMYSDTENSVYFTEAYIRNYDA